MKKLQVVKPDRLVKYERAKINNVSFELEGDSLKRVKLSTSEGPLEFWIDSYAIKVYETAKRKVFRVVIIDTNNLSPDQIKDYYSSEDREYFCSALKRSNENVEIVLSDFEELEV